MYRSTLLATLASFVLATGCIGSLDTGTPIGDDDDDDTPAGPDAGGGGDSAAEALFTSNVKPLMGRCVSCHAGTATYPLMFLGPGPDSQYYDSIVARPEVTGGFEPAIASLITKLEGGTHQGLADWTAGEEQAISEWLLAEKDERGGDVGDGDDPLPSDSKQALAEWSGCMTKANWDTAEMGTWSDKPAEGGTVCSSCHNDGLQRFNANADNDTMFEMNRYEVFVISFVTVKVELDGTNTVVPAYDKLVRMGNGSTLHPTYNTNLADTYFTRLQNFYDLTMQAKTNGQCGPAQFPQP